MSAFWSATDDNDEQETRLFGVIGKVTSATPEIKVRARCAGKSIDLDIWDVFENPFPNVEVPEEWFDRVTYSLDTGKGHATNWAEYEDRASQYYRNTGNWKTYNGKSSQATGKGKGKGKGKGTQRDFSQIDNDIQRLTQTSFAEFYGEEEFDEDKKALVNMIVNELDDDEIEAVLTKLADLGYDAYMEKILLKL